MKNLLTALNSKATEKIVNDYLNSFSGVFSKNKSKMIKVSENIKVLSRLSDKKISKEKITIKYIDGKEAIIDVEFIYNQFDISINTESVVDGTNIKMIKVIDYDGRVLKDTVYVDRTKEKDIFKLYDKDGKIIEEGNSVTGIRKNFIYDDKGRMTSIKCISEYDGEQEIKFETEFDESGEYIDSLTIIY